MRRAAEVLEVAIYSRRGESGRSIALPRKLFEEKEPSIVVVRAFPKGAASEVLKAQFRLEPGEQGIVAREVYDSIAKGLDGAKNFISVTVRPASMLDRLWYKKRARYELIVAVLSWLAAIIGGIVALINGLAGTMAAVIPALLIVTFFVVTALATTFRLVLDINKAEV